jgi:shikimate dehydrogenase
LLSGATQLVGLIGMPVDGSLSPAMQNAAFAARGLDWAYLPLPVEDGRLEDAVRGLAALGFSGANVTAPYKVEAGRVC